MGPTRTTKSRASTSSAAAPRASSSGFAAPPPAHAQAGSSSAGRSARSGTTEAREASAAARKERNRIAAQASRDRKVQEIGGLKAENDRLRERIAELEGGTAGKKVAGGGLLIEQRLRKEIVALKEQNRELKAQLDEASDGADQLGDDDEMATPEAEDKVQRTKDTDGITPPELATPVIDNTPVAGLPSSMNRGRVFGLFRKMVGIKTVPSESEGSGVETD